MLLSPAKPQIQYVLVGSETGRYSKYADKMSAAVATVVSQILNI